VREKVRGVASAAGASFPASRCKPWNAPPPNWASPTASILWAVDRYEERYFNLPKDLNDLVVKGLLKPPPPPPAGKKYVLDAHNRELTIVDK